MKQQINLKTMWSWPLLMLLLVTSMRGWASPPTLTVSVLQYGTAHWELRALQHLGLDHEYGFELVLRPVANLSASRLAVTSGSVDAAVADLLWAQSRYLQNDPFCYLPFSSSIGEILVPAGSSVSELGDLGGRRIGVAGGPDSKGWKLLKAVVGDHELDDSTVQFAAPPLLNETLRRGRVDAIVTYWHFGARLRADTAVETAFDMTDLLSELGLSRDLPVLGYVFREDWVAAHPDRVEQFRRSIRATKNRLLNDGGLWQTLRPVMRQPDEQTLTLLRHGFRDGTPEPLDDERVRDLQRLLKVLGVEEGRVMPARLFIRPSES